MKKQEENSKYKKNKETYTIQLEQYKFHYFSCPIVIIKQINDFTVTDIPY